LSSSLFSSSSSYYVTFLFLFLPLIFFLSCSLGSDAKVAFASGEVEEKAKLVFKRLTETTIVLSQKMN
jgi:hypothetical protein